MHPTYNVDDSRRETCKFDYGKHYSSSVSYEMSLDLFHAAGHYYSKKAVLSQGNRAMPQLFYSV